MSTRRIISSGTLIVSSVVLILSLVAYAREWTDIVSALVTLTIAVTVFAGAAIAVLDRVQNEIDRLSKKLRRQSEGLDDEQKKILRDSLTAYSGFSVEISYRLFSEFCAIDLEKVFTDAGCKPVACTAVAFGFDRGHEDFYLAATSEQDTARLIRIFERARLSTRSLGISRENHVDVYIGRIRS